MREKETQNMKPLKKQVLSIQREKGTNEIKKHLNIFFPSFIIYMYVSTLAVWVPFKQLKWLKETHKKAILLMSNNIFGNLNEPLRSH